MEQPNRRTFIKNSTLATVVATGVSKASAHTAGTIRVGLIGHGGRGAYLARQFSAQPNVEITGVADVDEQHRNKEIATQSSGVKRTSDFRNVLKDRDVDAVIVATPDHWHAPAAIMACQAGKHVYVEKPCSHNVHEGRMLVEAAVNSDVIVQHGTQVRSTDMMIDAVKLLREGIIGDVLVAKCWNIQKRGNIGQQHPTDVPAGLDYDSWVGPAPFIPYQENRVRGGWHWWYHFGTGDMGNDGVHDIDYARWGLGVTNHPTRVTAVGGKFFFHDDQQFPDTQQVAFEYSNEGEVDGNRVLIYEQRLWSTNYPHNVDSGAEFYGTAGQMFLSRRGKIQVWGDRNKPLDVDVTPEAQNADKHIANFLSSIRTGEPPNADVNIGHLTSSLCHLGNIAVRLGKSFDFDAKSELAPNDPDVNKLLGRSYRDHWGKPRL